MNAPRRVPAAKLENRLLTAMTRFLTNPPADLIAILSGQVVSRYERLDRSPSLETVLACQVLFDVLPHELYPGLYQKVENLTRQRIHALIGQFEDTFDEGAVAYKRDVLTKAIERIGSRGPSL